MKMPIPELEAQKKISTIISKYDELIRNNTKRFQILEEMAQRLYREWFVNFRFPGHENVKMLNLELGMIPEKWKVKKLHEIVTLSRNNIKPSDYPEESFYHFSIPAFDQGKMPLVELGNTILSGKYIINNGCVLFSKLNPRIKRIWLPFIGKSYRAIASTEFLILKPKSDKILNFLYHFLSTDSFYNEALSLSLGTSTSHQRIKPKDFMELRMTMPVNEIIEKFEINVSPIIEQIQVLREKNEKLSKTRDLLLPKLISGKIDVSDLDINIGATDV